LWVQPRGWLELRHPCRACRRRCQLCLQRSRCAESLLKHSLDLATARLEQGNSLRLRRNSLWALRLSTRRWLQRQLSLLRPLRQFLLNPCELLLLLPLLLLLLSLRREALLVLTPQAHATVHVCRVCLLGLVLLGLWLQRQWYCRCGTSIVPCGGADANIVQRNLRSSRAVVKVIRDTPECSSHLRIHRIWHSVRHG
jgi:hypothetical protein